MAPTTELDLKKVDALVKVEVAIRRGTKKVLELKDDKRKLLQDMKPLEYNEYLKRML